MKKTSRTATLVAGVCMTLVGHRSVAQEASTFQEPSVAKESAPTGKGFYLAPSVSLVQTFTNNANPGSGEKRADSVTQISPAIHVRSAAGRLQGTLDYSLSGVVHARDSGASNVQQTLAAQLHGELVPSVAFVDVRASIGQQSVSALGLQTSTPSLQNGNRTEVATLALSPYVRTPVGQFADLEVRLNQTIARSSQSATGDSESLGGSIHLGSQRRGLLGWSVDFNRQTTDFSAGRQTVTQRLVGGISYSITPDLIASARAGQESNDVLGLNSQTYDTAGIGLSWIPSERTSLAADIDKRYFGKSYSLRFTHRSPRTVWQLSAVQSATADQSNAGSAGAAVTVYDLLFQQFASLVPDPIQRDALVNAYLRDNGLSGNALARTGLLSSGATLDRRFELSFGLIGPRSSLMLSAYDSSTRRLDSVVQTADDFAGGNQLNVRSVSMTGSHRINPTDALAAAVTYQDTTASLTGDHSKLRSASLTWSTRIGARSTASAGVRRSIFSNATQPYSETAVFITVAFAL